MGNDSRPLFMASAGFELSSAAHVCLELLEGVKQDIHASKPSEHPHLLGQHLLLY